MQDLKCEPPFKLVKRKLYQVAFCSPVTCIRTFLAPLQKEQQDHVHVNDNGDDDDENDEDEKKYNEV